MKARIPGYRRRSDRNVAFVEIRGRRHYLGTFDSPESWERYWQLVNAELARRDQERLAAKLPARVVTTRPNVAELVEAFWLANRDRYTKHGEPTSERRMYRIALRPLRELRGATMAEWFGPRDLVVCRDWMKAKGYCRKKINQHVGRIRRVFKWGVSQGLISAPVWQALTAVEGLRRGEAPDRPKVKPVRLAYVRAIKRFVSPPIWALIRFQLLTGCRPGEACSLRAVDLSMRGNDVWEYRPARHKTEHHDFERVIWIGPRGKRLLQAWLTDNVAAALWSPATGRAAYLASVTTRSEAYRQTTKRYRLKKRVPKGKSRRPRECYSVGSYGDAIERACKKAGVPHWAPNQLRHAAATNLRREFGIELTRIILGHKSMSTSEIYGERDAGLARAAMQRKG